MENEMKNLVRQLLEILDSKEETANGAEFSPTTINSCRVIHTINLDRIFKRLRELVNDK